MMFASRIVLRKRLNASCGQKQRGGVRDPLDGQFEEVMRYPLLEGDHAQAVHEGLACVAVDEVPHSEVREIEPEPDDELKAEVPPTARQHTTSQSGDSLHAATLISGVTGGLLEGD
jgi:hypothetical protein